MKEYTIFCLNDDHKMTNETFNIKVVEGGEYLVVHFERKRNYKVINYNVYTYLHVSADLWQTCTIYSSTNRYNNIDFSMGHI